MNRIYGAGVEVIADALKLNTTIASVNLGCECCAGTCVRCHVVVFHVRAALRGGVYAMRDFSQRHR